MLRAALVPTGLRRFLLRDCHEPRQSSLGRVRSGAEIVTRLPESLRAVARNAIWSYGEATARFRVLPDFLIAGTQRGGTSALFSYLRRHPGITGPAWKEVSYFDRHYARGPAWYRGNFPTARGARGRLVGEASPNTLSHPLAAERTAALLPDARLITLLRDPVDRAFSHYQHERALGREPLSFEQALAVEDERLRGELERMRADRAYFSDAWWNHAYFARGLYADQLERWIAAFPREGLLILASDELFADPGGTYARVLEFLGAEPYELDSYPAVFSREYGPMSPETRTELAQRYAEPNRRLYRLLGRELGWTVP